MPASSFRSGARGGRQARAKLCALQERSSAALAQLKDLHVS
jgi:hypothetical protein